MCLVLFLFPFVRSSHQRILSSTGGVSTMYQVPRRCYRKNQVSLFPAALSEVRVLGTNEIISKIKLLQPEIRVMLDTLNDSL